MLPEEQEVHDSGDEADPCHRAEEQDANVVSQKETEGPFRKEGRAVVAGGVLVRLQPRAPDPQVPEQEHNPPENERPDICIPTFPPVVDSQHRCRQEDPRRDSRRRPEAEDQQGIPHEAGGTPAVGAPDKGAQEQDSGKGFREHLVVLIGNGDAPQDKQQRRRGVDSRLQVVFRDEAHEHHGRACHEKCLEEPDKPAQTIGVGDQRRHDGGEQGQAGKNLAVAPGPGPVEPGLEAECPAGFPCDRIESIACCRSGSFRTSWYSPSMVVSVRS